jgi:hypothetical protein
MKMKHFKRALLLGALVSVPLMAGGCEKSQAPDDGSGRVSSARSRAGKDVKRGKRGATISGGGSLSAGSSFSGGSSTRGPEPGTVPTSGGP